MASRPVTDEMYLDGPAGRLEALLEAPGDAEPRANALVCHPHPEHGGSLGNKVVHTLARAFLGRGMRALRFNFRGVGASGGQFDDGRGELDDALAAYDYLSSRWPDTPIWAAGFSFGAAMAARLTMRRRVAGLVTVAPAVRRFAADIDEPPDCPWLIVQGDQDEVVPLDETLEWVNALPPGPELEVFPDTGHFFHGKLVPLREAVDRFVAEHG